MSLIKENYSGCIFVNRCGDYRKSSKADIDCEKCKNRSNHNFYISDIKLSIAVYDDYITVNCGEWFPAFHIDISLDNRCISNQHVYSIFPADQEPTIFIYNRKCIYSYGKSVKIIPQPRDLELFICFEYNSSINIIYLNKAGRLVRSDLNGSKCILSNNIIYKDNFIIYDIGNIMYVVHGNQAYKFYDKSIFNMKELLPYHRFRDYQGKIWYVNFF